MAAAGLFARAREEKKSVPEYGAGKAAHGVAMELPTDVEVIEWLSLAVFITILTPLRSCSWIPRFVARCYGLGEYVMTLDCCRATSPAHDWWNKRVEIPINDRAVIMFDASVVDSFCLYLADDHVVVDLILHCTAFAIVEFRTTEALIAPFMNFLL